MGATPQLAPLASVYIVPLLAVSPLYCTSYAFDPILRFQGLVKESMVWIGLGAVLNIFLEPLFIFSFRLGMLGAGIATAICQVLSFLLLAFIYRARGQVRIKLKFFRLGQFRPIFSTGMPTFLRRARTMDEAFWARAMRSSRSLSTRASSGSGMRVKCTDSAPLTRSQ